MRGRAGAFAHSDHGRFEIGGFRLAGKSGQAHGSGLLHAGLALACGEEHEIVPVDEFFAATVAENGFDITAFVADDALGVLARIGRKPARDLAA